MLDSVISSVIRQGSSPVPLNASASSSTRRSFVSSLGARLTQMPMSAASGMVSSHIRADRNASARTQRPTSNISPLSSAVSMNSLGASSPRSGWGQRTRASNAWIVPSTSETTGW